MKSVRDGLTSSYRRSCSRRGPPRKLVWTVAVLVELHPYLPGYGGLFSVRNETSFFWLCESPAHARTDLVAYLSPTQGPGPGPNSPKSGVSCLNRITSYLLATSVLWGLWYIARDSMRFFFRKESTLLIAYGTPNQANSLNSALATNNPNQL
jgi:ribosomal protein L24E